MDKLFCASNRNGEAGRADNEPETSHPAPLVFTGNELTLDGEWLKICPWGDFPNAAGAQRITQRDGDAMVAAFNSLRGRLARRFLGLPVYVGHPDVQPDLYADKRRYGKITELETRGDGLYGRVTWNDLGRTAIEQGHYLFNSPTWYMKRHEQFLRPVELVSVGLTNTPQIPGDAWAKNEPSTTPNTSTPQTTMPDSLQTILVNAGQIAAGAPETDAITALNALLELPARITALEQQLAAGVAERDALSAERRESELDLAVNAGRITSAERAAWNERLTADFPANAAQLRARKPVVNTAPRLAGVGSRKAEFATGKIAAINDALHQYATAHKLDLTTNHGHNAAFNGAKRQHPALFAR